MIYIIPGAILLWATGLVCYKWGRSDGTIIEKEKQQARMDKLVAEDEKKTPMSHRRFDERNN